MRTSHSNLFGKRFRLGPRPPPLHLHPNSQSSLPRANLLPFCRDRPLPPDPGFRGRARIPFLQSAQTTKPPRQVFGIRTGPRRAGTNPSVLPKRTGCRSFPSPGSARSSNADLFAKKTGCDKIVHCRIRRCACLEVSRGVPSVDVVSIGIGHRVIPAARRAKRFPAPGVAPGNLTSASVFKSDDDHHETTTERVALAGVLKA